MFLIENLAFILTNTTNQDIFTFSNENIFKNEQNGLFNYTICVRCNNN
jgi:hypothetical protein